MFELIKAGRDIAEGEVTAEEARRLTEKADEYSESDEPKKAFRLYKKANEVYAMLFANDPTTFRTDYAVSCEALGTAYIDIEKYKEAEDSFAAAADLLTDALSEDRQQYAEMYADQQCNIGDSYFYRGRYTEAEEKYQQALRLFGEAGKTFSCDVREDIAYCYDCIAKAECGKEAYTSAVEYYEKVISIYQELLGEAGEDKEKYVSLSDDLASAYNDMGYTYSCTGDYEDAEKYYLLAAEVYRKLVLFDSESYAGSLAAQYADLAALYEDMGDKEQKRVYENKAKNPDI